MPRDGSGTYSVPNTFLPNTVMSATAVNQNFTDAGSAITQSLARDGQSSMTGQFKAIAGTVGSPGISFGVDTNTGFRRASEDEMRWVGGGVDRMYIDSVGKAFFLGDVDIAGLIGLAAPLVIATTSASLLTLRRTENDTTARTVEQWQSGSGAGAVGSLQVVGDGNNAVQTMRWRVNSVAAFETTQSLFTADLPMAVGSSLLFSTSGYVDMAEVAAPATPSADVARIYAVDSGGTTRLQFKDGSGNIINIPASSDLQVFTASSTWVKPAFGTMAFIQVWGGGGSGGRAGTGDGGGGGGGGAYIERYVALASLSSSVSVTVGAGGAAQTADNTDGSTGGQTSFGAYATAYGGAGGNGDAAGDNPGGGGGGLTSAGTVGGGGGGPGGRVGSATIGATFGDANPFGGATAGDVSVGSGGTALYGGGGGGGGSGTNTETAGGASVFGGGGGGGGSDTGTGAAGGAGIVYGGNGGAGNTGNNAGTAGTVPGGGGGGTETANSGAGARGEVRVTVF